MVQEAMIVNNYSEKVRCFTECIGLYVSFTVFKRLHLLISTLNNFYLPGMNINLWIYYVLNMQIAVFFISDMHCILLYYFMSFRSWATLCSFTLNSFLLCVPLLPVPLFTNPPPDKTDPKVN